MRAEVRALRAQISPHFIYNSLGAIASFVRTDPDRARDLLLEFADFTRYSFRQHGEFTTLAEELRSIERYLLLEQARFGDRLQVTLQVAPEVLGVSVPFLCLQPLVENAVQHGLEADAGRRSDLHRGPRRRPRVRDRHRGQRRRPGPRAHPRRCSPGRPAATRSGWPTWTSGCAPTFGDEYGLVVETAPGAGTRVVVRVPEVRPRCRHMSTPARPAGAGHRRRAAGARRAHLPARARRARRARCTRPTPPPRRCGCCSSSRSTRSSSTSRCPGSPASSSPRCCPASRPRPSAVFVTAHDQHAVDAFELNAVDYVLKPVRERAPGRGRTPGPGRRRAPSSPRSRCPVERGGVTRFVPVSQIRYVEAEGDYARLHTADDSHLVRVPLTQLEQDWADAGFVRIHRSMLIATAFVDEVRVDGGRCTVVIGDQRAPGRADGTPASCATSSSATPDPGRSRRGRQPEQPVNPPERVRVTSPWTERPRLADRAVRRPRRSTPRARSARSTCAPCCVPSCGWR